MGSSLTRSGGSTSVRISVMELQPANWFALPRRRAVNSGSRTTVLVGVVLAAAVSAGPGCRQSQPSSETPAAPPQSTADTYTPPPEGTSSLVQSLTARRDSDGQVKIGGKILLPATTRIWVEVYPSTAGMQDQLLGRSELYLDPGGTFEAGPFKLSGAGPFRVQVTSYFSRSWQPADVLRAVGQKGTRLPKSALKLDDPRSPIAGGHLEYSGSVNIGSS
jgi:hypothetical protein